MRVEADQHLCIGSGQCVMVAPDIYDQDDNGIVVLLQEEPGEALHEAARESAAICPAAAIRLAQ